MRSPLQANLAGGEEAAGPERFDRLDAARRGSVGLRHLELGFSKRFVKDEGVGDDGHRHASRLPFLVVRLAEHVPNLRASSLSYECRLVNSSAASLTPFSSSVASASILGGGNGGPMHKHC